MEFLEETSTFSLQQRQNLHCASDPSTDPLGIPVQIRSPLRRPTEPSSIPRENQRNSGVQGDAPGAGSGFDSNSIVREAIFATH